jgi:peroxiredoxin Q/BCP
MPRRAAPKAAEDGEPAEAQAPRRSTRISSQPKPDEEPAKPAKKPAAPRKKRNADEAGTQDGDGTKKVGIFPPPNVSATHTQAGVQAKLDDSAEGSSTVDLAPLDIGDTLPSYTLKNEKDEDIDVSALTAEKGLVLFLVPKADTRELAPAYSPGALFTIISWMHNTGLWVPGCLS